MKGEGKAREECRSWMLVLLERSEDFARGKEMFERGRVDLGAFGGAYTEFCTSPILPPAIAFLAALQHRVLLSYPHPRGG